MADMREIWRVITRVLLSAQTEPWIVEPQRTHCYKNIRYAAPVGSITDKAGNDVALTYCLHVVVENKRNAFFVNAYPIASC